MVKCFLFVCVVASALFLQSVSLANSSSSSSSVEEDDTESHHSDETRAASQFIYSNEDDDESEEYDDDHDDHEKKFSYQQREKPEQEAFSLMKAKRMLLPNFNIPKALFFTHNSLRTQPLMTKHTSQTSAQQQQQQQQQQQHVKRENEINSIRKGPWKKPYFVGRK